VKPTQWFVVIFFFLCLVSILRVPVVSAQTTPGPPGLQGARQYESTHPLEAPQPPVRKIDLAQLQREADELSTLAQSIPADVRSVTQGMLSKDMLEKLRKIEKISKHLRSEISP